jgi:hypothetical protein
MNRPTSTVLIVFLETPMPGQLGLADAVRGEPGTATRQASCRARANSGIRRRVRAMGSGVFLAEARRNGRR